VAKLDSGKSDKPLSWRRKALLGHLLVIALFGVAGVWAANAPLASSVHAGGVLQDRSLRQSVQHLEGGIIREVLVRDGDWVEKGQVLIRLDPTQIDSNRESGRVQLGQALVMEARLVAEQKGAMDFLPPAELIDLGTSAEIDKAITDERQNMRQRAANEDSARRLVERRIEQIRADIAGFEERKESARRQIAVIDKELPGLRELLRKGLTQLNRVTTLERGREEYAAQLASAENGILKANEQIKEQVEVQRSREEGFKASVATSLLETRRQLAELRNRLKIAEDRDRRIDIKAPLAGVVQALKATTVGSVVTPGSTVLEISPVSKSLMVRAKILPRDAEAVHVGQIVVLRLSGFQDKDIPQIKGTVTSMSNDVIMDQEARSAVFEADISLDITAFPEKVQERLRPGLPVEAIIATGENTVLGYLVDPLLFNLRASMNEE
jgi:HlyD family secretion protein